MQVMVTGGMGALGRLVVRELDGRGHTVRSASRRTGVDLATGAGLDAALDGIDAVVHTADTNDPRRWKAVTVGGTRTLAAAVGAMTTPAHVVAISIVGCDLSPYPYYRAKTRAEQALATADVPSTLVRATQFHTLVAAAGRAVTFGPVAIGIRGMAVQPCDPAWVAARLADLAVGPAPRGFSRATDLAGPDVLDLPAVTAALAARRGRGAPRVVSPRPFGAVMRGFADRVNLPGTEVETGGSRFADWLAGSPAAP